MTNRDREREDKSTMCDAGRKKNRKKNWPVKRDSAPFWTPLSRDYHYKQHQSAAFLMKTPKEIPLNFCQNYWFGCPILTDVWSTPCVKHSKT